MWLWISIKTDSDDQKHNYLTYFRFHFSLVKESATHNSFRVSTQVSKTGVYTMAGNVFLYPHKYVSTHQLRGLFSNQRFFPSV